MGNGYGAGLTDSLHEAKDHAVGQPQVTHHQVAVKTITDHDVRCQAKVIRRDLPGQPEKVCGRLLAEMVGRPWVLRCSRCKAKNVSPS